MPACHMQTYANNKSMKSHELACAGKKRSEISGEKRFFRSSHNQRNASSISRAHSGIVRARNTKVCTVVSNSTLRRQILLINSWPSRSRSSFLLLSSLQHNICVFRRSEIFFFGEALKTVDTEREREHFPHRSSFHCFSWKSSAYNSINLKSGETMKRQLHRFQSLAALKEREQCAITMRKERC
jgi:hypothetical protein